MIVFTLEKYALTLMMLKVTFTIVKSLDVCTLPNCFKCLQIMGLEHCQGCQIGYYLDDINCMKCDIGCQSCQDYNICSQCQNNYKIDPLNKNRCTLDCAGGCATCLGTTTNCTVCEPGYFRLGSSCFPCSPECKTCDKNAKNCITCDLGRILDSGTCICDDKSKYLNWISNTCIDCDKECVECIGPSNANCTKCPDGFVLAGRKCMIDSRKVSNSRNRLKLSNKLILYYQFIDENYIEFTINYNGKGWIGFGLGYSMINSETTVCTFIDGKPKIYQTVLKSKRQIPDLIDVPFDMSPVYLIKAETNDTNTIFSFRRNIHIELNAGLDLNPGKTVSIVWALGDKMELNYHGAYRGIVDVTFDKTLICDISCQTCFGPDENNCLSCFGGSFFSTESNTCERCHLTCERCNGHEERDCTSCSPDENRILINGLCLENPQIQKLYLNHSSNDYQNSIHELSDFAGSFSYLARSKNQHNYMNNFCLSSENCSSIGDCSRFSCKCPDQMYGMHCEISNETIKKNSRKIADIFRTLYNMTSNKLFEYRVQKSKINLLDALTLIKDGFEDETFIKNVIEIVDELLLAVVIPQKDNDKLTETAIKVITRTLEILSFFQKNLSDSARSSYIMKTMYRLDSLLKFWIYQKMSLNSLINLQIDLMTMTIGRYNKDCLKNFTLDYEKLLNTSEENSRSIFHFGEDFPAALANCSNTTEFYIILTEWKSLPSEKFAKNSRILITSSLNLTIRDSLFTPVALKNSFIEIELKKKIDNVFAISNNIIICTKEEGEKRSSEIINYILETDSYVKCKINNPIGGVYSVEVKLASEFYVEEKLTWRLQKNYGFALIIALYVLYATIAVYYFFSKPVKGDLLMFPSKSFSPRNQKSNSKQKELKLSPKEIPSDCFLMPKLVNSDGQIGISMVESDPILDVPKEKMNEESLDLRNRLVQPSKRESDKNDEKTASVPPGGFSEKVNEFGGRNKHSMLVDDGEQDLEVEEGETDNEEESEEIANAYSIWNLHPIFAAHKTIPYFLKMQLLSLIYTNIIFSLTILSISFDIFENNSNEDIKDGHFVRIAIITEVIMWPLNYFIGLWGRKSRKRILRRASGPNSETKKLWVISKSFWLYFGCIAFFFGVIISWKLSFLSLYNSDFWLYSFMILLAIEYLIVDPILIIFLKLGKKFNRSAYILSLRYLRLRGFYIIRRLQ